MRSRKQLELERRKKELELKRFANGDAITSLRCLVRVMSENSKGAKESLRELKESLVKSKDMGVLKYRVTNLIENGFAELVNSLERSESFSEISREFVQIMNAAYPRGFQRQLLKTGKRSFNQNVTELKQLIREHGFLDVNDRGDYIKAPIIDEVEEENDEDQDEEDQEDTEEEEQEQQQPDLEKTMSRTFSVASEAALSKLSTFREQLDKIKNQVDAINSRLTEQSNGGDVQDKRLGKFKTELGLLNGRVDKLQFSGIDSVMVGPLTSGKVDARALRKKLNKRASELSKQIKAIHSRIGKDLYYRSISNEKNNNS